MVNEIILRAETELVDNAAREQLEKVWRRIDVLNDRTKNHTIQIRELEKKIKKLKSHTK